LDISRLSKHDLPMPKRVRKVLKRLTGIPDDDHFKYLVGLQALVALVSLSEGLAFDALNL
jgi:hypothetical protein